MIFWTSWAAPSLLELQRLARRSVSVGERSALVLAINDGEPPAHARAVFERQGVDATFVPDPERKIAGLYRVHCWPTTISVDGRGRVSAIHMGRSHEPPDDLQSATSR